MFTKNFKNMLAGFGMSYLNSSTSGIRLKTRAGATRYLSMSSRYAEYYTPCCFTCGTSFTTNASSTKFNPVHLDWACTAHGDGSTANSRDGLIFSDSCGVTEDSYILPGTEFFPLSKFSIAIKSRTMSNPKDDTIQYKVVYSLSSKVSTDTIIGSLGYYVHTIVGTTKGSTATTYGQLLMIAIDLGEPVTIPANSAADLTVTIQANGQAWAEIT